MADDISNKQAAKNAARSAADLKKQKKKRWFPIISPELFGSRVMGESLLDDSSQLMNRSITLSVMHLTGDMKKQNMNILFKVTDVKEGKGLTTAMSFELSPSSVKRLAKREKDKLSDSFVVKTEDGKLVRIKPLMITNNLASGKVKAALIKNCRAICKELVNKMKYQALLTDVISYKFQKDVRDMLHTTYPLRNFDIRQLLLETHKKKETVEEEMLLKLKRQKELQLAEKNEQQEMEKPKVTQADEIEPSDSQAEQLQEKTQADEYDEQ